MSAFLSAHDLQGFFQGNGGDGCVCFREKIIEGEIPGLRILGLVWKSFSIISRINTSHSNKPFS